MAKWLFVTNGSDKGGGKMLTVHAKFTLGLNKLVFIDNKLLGIGYLSSTISKS